MLMKTVKPPSWFGGGRRAGVGNKARSVGQPHGELYIVIINVPPKRGD